MSDHYVITADRGHLRIFKHRETAEQPKPSLDELDSADFPRGLASYTSRDTDMAGRFQNSSHQARGPGAPTQRTGMSIDERLPKQREEERREVRDLAETIEAFLRTRPDATWDFAAAPAIHQAVLDAVSPATRARLRRSVAKDLVHQPPGELIEHFAAQETR